MDVDAVVEFADPFAGFVLVGAGIVEVGVVEVAPPGPPVTSRAAKSAKASGWPGSLRV